MAGQKSFIDADGLPSLSVGTWTEEKHRHLKVHLDIFSTGMKKWGERVYIDLYAGPGSGKVEETQKLLNGSPLLALSAKLSFDKYIFCEKDPR